MLVMVHPVPPGGGSISPAFPAAAGPLGLIDANACWPRIRGNGRSRRTGDALHFGIQRRGGTSNSDDQLNCGRQPSELKGEIVAAM